jgi:dCMP deaminase
MTVTDRDHKHLRLARSVADIFSKDPSTKVGAVVLGDQPNQLALGFNGLPPGLADDSRLLDRAWKNAHVRHAEANALSNVSGFTPRVIFSTHFPCQQCALAILTARTVRRVVTFEPEGDYGARWAESTKASRDIFCEAGVTVDEVLRAP